MPRYNGWTDPMKLDAFRSDTYFLSFGSVAFLFVVHFLVRSEKKMCCVCVGVDVVCTSDTYTKKKLLCVIG